VPGSQYPGHPERGTLPAGGKATRHAKPSSTQAGGGPPPHSLTVTLAFPRREREGWAVSACGGQGPQTWSQQPRELARRDAPPETSLQPPCWEVKPPKGSETGPASPEKSDGVSPAPRASGRSRTCTPACARQRGKAGWVVFRRCSAQPWHKGRTPHPGARGQDPLGSSQKR